METLNYDGQDVPIIGTVIADDKEYVFHFTGTLCWFPGEPWCGFATTTFGDSGMDYTQTVKAFEQIAQDEWKCRDEQKEIVCSRRDFEAVKSWGKIEFN
jgi:hypothetical protein